jgi:uncharacterized membrane protein
MTDAFVRSATVAETRSMPRAWARVLPILLATLLLLTATGLVVGSLISYAAVKHRLDRYASDHDADLSPERFGTIVWQLRIAAAVLAGAGAATWRWRSRFADALEALLRSASADVRQARVALTRALAAESALHLGALGLVVAGSAVVRLEFLFQPMRYDEAGTYVHYASQPLYIGLTTYTAPNNHLLNTFLIHVSTALFGDAPWAIRLPALLAGILLVPATYLAARLVYDRQSALLAAAFVATASVLIEFSTNARGYTMVALAFVLLVALAAHLPRTESPAAWSLLAILGAVGIFAVPIFLYAFGSVVAWLVGSLLLETRALLRSRLLPAVLAFAALAALLYAPVIATSGLRAVVRNTFVEPQTWSYFAHHLPSSLASSYAGWHRDQPAPLWIVLALGFVVAIVLYHRVGRTRLTPLAGVVAFIPPVLVLQHVVPFERTWLFLLPLYLMAAAAGIVFVAGLVRAPGQWGAAVPVLAVVLCAALAAKAVASQAVYRSEDTSTFRDAPQVASFLEQELRPGDRLIVVPPADLILEYYLDAKGFDAGRLLYTDFDAERVLAVVKPPPDGYRLPEVLRWRLSPDVVRGVRPILLRRFPHSAVYELAPRNG